MTTITGRGFLDDQFNLICPDGHKHWAPEPEKFVWRECLAATHVDTTKKGRTVVGRCNLKLEKLPGTLARGGER